MTAFQEIQISSKKTELWSPPSNTRYWSELTNKSHGCPLGCIYCNQEELDVDPITNEKTAGYLQEGVDGGLSINTRLMLGGITVREMTIEKLFRELKTYPFYTRDTSVLIQNFNDPGLNWDESIEIGSKLVEEFDHQGSIVFITKAGISERNVTQMKKLKNGGGKPIVVVTYSGLPKEIEPVSGQIRIETMQKLHEAGIPVILSMRPMIVGINANEDNIRQIARTSAQYADIIIVGGLYVYSFTSEAFQKAGYPLGDLYTNHRYSIVKVLPDNVRPMVREIIKQENIKASVHDHTACAIAQIMTLLYKAPKTDRLAHWAGNAEIDFNNCIDFCHPSQMCVCQETSNMDSEVKARSAEKALKRIGLQYPVVPSDTQAGLLLIKGASLPVDVLFHLYEQTGWAVNNWPNFEDVIKKTKDALEQDIGVSSDLLLGAVPIGQEWYVFVDGELDGQGNITSSRWIRGRNRARIQIVDAHDLNQVKIEELLPIFVEKARGLQTEEEIEQNLMTIYSKVNS